MTAWTAIWQSNLNVKFQRLNTYDDAAATIANRDATIVIKSDGSLSGWGLNTYGILGSGSSIPPLNPVLVNGI